MHALIELGRETSLTGREAEAYRVSAVRDVVQQQAANARFTRNIHIYRGNPGGIPKMYATLTTTNITLSTGGPAHALFSLITGGPLHALFSCGYSSLAWPTSIPAALSTECPPPPAAASFARVFSFVAIVSLTTVFGRRSVVRCHGVIAVTSYINLKECEKVRESFFHHASEHARRHHVHGQKIPFSIVRIGGKGPEGRNQNGRRTATYRTRQ